MSVPCVLLSAQRGYALASSRRLLIERFLRLGWQVVLATTDDEYSQKLVAEGAVLAEVRFRRGGFFPPRDLAAYLALWRALRSHRPALVHNFHAKPVILGSLAARAALGSRCRIVNTITGLGHAFIAGGFVRNLAAMGYRLSLPRADATVFQNRADGELFRKAGWVPAGGDRLIPGSGVDARRFCPAEVAGGPTPPKVIMVGRLIWQKGVREFVEAAGLVKRHIPEATFLLVGETDPDHPDAVTPEFMAEVRRQGIVEFAGYRRDLEALLPDCTLFVLPSYREGLPRGVLEAAACGLPTVGADVPGTRDVVVHGETGLLVPPRDTEALAGAIVELLTAPDRRVAMGLAARRRVEAEFTIEAITDRYCRLYRELGVPGLGPESASTETTAP